MSIKKEGKATNEDFCHAPSGPPGGQFQKPFAARQ
jgi:hypothetical protein